MTAAEQARAEVEAWWGSYAPWAMTDDGAAIIKLALIERLTPVFERAQARDAQYFRADVEANATMALRERAERAEADVARLRGALREVLQQFTPEHLDVVSGPGVGSECRAALAATEPR